MGTIPTLSKFTAGTPIVASVMNSHFEAIVTVVNGGLDNSNISQISAEKVTSGEFDPNRIPLLTLSHIPRLTEAKLPQWSQGFLKARGVGTDPAYELVQWGDVQLKPAQATRWPTWDEVTGIPSAFPPEGHKHDAGDIDSGILAMSYGGTGVSSLRTGLYVRVNSAGTGLETRTNTQVVSDTGAAPADHTHSLSGTSITGTLPVSKGGTGVSSLTTNRYVRVNSAGTGLETRTNTQVLGDIGANDASNLNTGTIPSARLPATITGDKTFSGRVNITGSLVLPTSF